MNPSFQDKISQITEYDSRYAKEAYALVAQSIQNVIQNVKRQEGEGRHITAAEILGGLAVNARALFGPLTVPVLESWGIHYNRDVGNMVYNMICRQIFTEGPGDTPESFEGESDLKSLIAHIGLPPPGANLPPASRIE